VIGECAGFIFGQIKRHNPVNMGSKSHRVIPEIDVYRAANLLITRYGANGVRADAARRPDA